MKRNNPVLFLCLVGAMTGVAAMPLSTALSQNFRSAEPLEQQDADIVAATRQAGLHNDHSQAGRIALALRNPLNPAHLYISIHALAQMGSEASLPALDQYIRHTGVEKDMDQDVSNFASAAKARLLAESTGQSSKESKTLAPAKTKRFFAELGLSPAALNADMNAYSAPQQPVIVNGNKVYVGTSDIQKIHPAGVYAARELADMIYQGRYEDYASLLEVQAVDFSQDYPSALKVRLAQVPREKRLATIIQELSHKPSIKFSDYYEIQLAANEGTTGSAAAAAELKKMDTNREQYNQINHSGGFGAMFRIIWGVGDTKQAPLLAYFKNDSNRSVAHYANIMYDDVLQGVKREAAPAY